MSTPTRRDQHKAARRADLIASASALWRDRGVGQVSIQEIAHTAGLVPQTIYNLVGGLDSLMFAVIEELLDRLDDALAEIEDRGVARSLRCVRVSAALFARDPGLYRQLIVRIPQAIFAGADFARDSAQIQMRAVGEAQAAGEIRQDVDAVALGHHIFVGYMGALYAWACGGLDETSFARAAELSALSPLTSVATDSARPALTERLVLLLGQQASQASLSA